MIFDSTLCSLGEGVLWHPLRHSLFWFDINNKCMFERTIEAKKAKIWQFDEYVSAAGWVNYNQLMIASESKLFLFHLENKRLDAIVPLEKENKFTRSNDGRADPFGGFWIGTMAKQAELNEGAIYRYYRGELRKLYANITIPNSICFSPEGDTAYYCDTNLQQIMKVQLDSFGWPKDESILHINLQADGLRPDGSVIDVEGNLWNAQWGAHRVACYSSDGQFQQAVTFEASQISCPAFGGVELNVLFATSAAENIAQPGKENAGALYYQEMNIKGQLEPPVIL